MGWIAWYFVPDVWLCSQVSQGGSWEPMLLTIGSAIINSVAPIVISAFLVFMSQKLGVSSVIKKRIDMALAHQEGNGRRMVEYLRRYRYKYVIIFLLNLIPFVPYVTAGTIFYAVATKSVRASIAISVGAIVKVGILTAIVTIVRLMSG